MRHLIWVVLALLRAASLPGTAQYRAIRARCDVSDVVVHAASIAALTAALLQKAATDIEDGIGRLRRILSNLPRTVRRDLNQGGVIMAIGSLHLPGETGMINLLRKARFTVTRMPSPGEVPA